MRWRMKEVWLEALKNSAADAGGGVAGRDRSAVSGLLRLFRRSLPPVNPDGRDGGSALCPWLAPSGTQKHGTDGRGDSRGRPSSHAPHAERIGIVGAGGTGSCGSGGESAVGGTRG